MISILDFRVQMYYSSFLRYKEKQASQKKWKFLVL